MSRKRRLSEDDLARLETGRPQSTNPMHPTRRTPEPEPDITEAKRRCKLLLGRTQTAQLRHPVAPLPRSARNRAL